jgi:hypothetical protein
VITFWESVSARAASEGRAGGNGAIAGVAASVVDTNTTRTANSIMMVIKFAYNPSLLSQKGALRGWFAINFLGVVQRSLFVGIIIVSLHGRAGR